MFSLFITGVIKNKYISGPQSKVRRMWAKFEWKQIIDVVQQRMPFHFQWPLLRSLLTQIFMSGSKRENDKALSESFIFYSSTLSFSLLVPLSFLLPFILSRFVVFPSASLTVSTKFCRLKKFFLNVSILLMYPFTWKWKVKYRGGGNSGQHW